jgi:glucokinase
MSETPAITRISNSKPPYYWGIDIGGTGIKIGLVDDSGQTLAYEHLPTRESDGATSAVQRIGAVMHEVHERLQIADAVRSIGVGAPGPMDLHRGLLVSPPQLPSWQGFNIRDAIKEEAQRPVTFLNDASAAAYGEYWLGSGRNDSSMIMLTLGTGVGGGIIINDSLVDGVNSFASEFGHIMVDPSPTAQLCVWGGGRGQLEAYASASGVVSRTRAKLSAGARSTLTSSLGSNDSELTAKRVYQAAVAGDVLAREVIDETAFWLGIGITTLVHTLDPGLVVLGGAMNFGGPDCPIGQHFLSTVTAEFRRRTFEYVFLGTAIRYAQLSGDAGYLGAAGYARKECNQK